MLTMNVYSPNILALKNDKCNYEKFSSVNFRTLLMLYILNCINYLRVSVANLRKKNQPLISTRVCLSVKGHLKARLSLEELKSGG